MPYHWHLILYRYCIVLKIRSPLLHISIDTFFTSFSLYSKRKYHASDTFCYFSRYSFFSLVPIRLSKIATTTLEREKIVHLFFFFLHPLYLAWLVCCVLFNFFYIMHTFHSCNAGKSLLFLLIHSNANEVAF